MPGLAGCTQAGLLPGTATASCTLPPPLLLPAPQETQLKGMLQLTGCTCYCSKARAGRRSAMFSITPHRADQDELSAALAKAPLPPGMDISDAPLNPLHVAKTKYRFAAASFEERAEWLASLQQASQLHPGELVASAWAAVFSAATSHRDAARVLQQLARVLAQPDRDASLLCVSADWARAAAAAKHSARALEAVHAGSAADVALGPASSPSTPPRKRESAHPGAARPHSANGRKSGLMRGLFGRKKTTSPPAPPAVLASPDTRASSEQQGELLDAFALASGTTSPRAGPVVPELHTASSPTPGSVVSSASRAHVVDAHTYADSASAVAASVATLRAKDPSLQLSQRRWLGDAGADQVAQQQSAARQAVASAAAAAQRRVVGHTQGDRVTLKQLERDVVRDVLKISCTVHPVYAGLLHSFADSADLLSTQMFTEASAQSMVLALAQRLGSIIVALNRALLAGGVPLADASDRESADWTEHGILRASSSKLSRSRVDSTSAGLAVDCELAADRVRRGSVFSDGGDSLASSAGGSSSSPMHSALPGEVGEGDLGFATAAMRPSIIAPPSLSPGSAYDMPAAVADALGAWARMDPAMPSRAWPYPAVAHSLEASILEFAREIMLCSSRTVTGGDSYDALTTLLASPHILLTPGSSGAPPISVDIRILPLPGSADSDAGRRAAPAHPAPAGTPAAPGSTASSPGHTTPRQRTGSYDVFSDEDDSGSAPGTPARGAERGSQMQSPLTSIRARKASIGRLPPAVLLVVTECSMQHMVRCGLGLDQSPDPARMPSGSSASSPAGDSSPVTLPIEEGALWGTMRATHERYFMWGARPLPAYVRLAFTLAGQSASPSTAQSPARSRTQPAS